MLTTLGSIEIGMGHDRYVKVLGAVSRLIPVLPGRDTHTNNLILLLLSFAMVAVCFASTVRDRFPQWSNALKCNLHAGASVVVLYVIVTTPLIALGEADLHYIQEAAWGLSCFALVFHLRYGFTMVWVLLTLSTAWGAVAIPIAMGGGCKNLICPTFLLSIIGIVTSLTSHTREHSTRSHFLAIRNSNFFSDNFRSILSNLMPPVAVDHLLNARHSSGEGGEFGSFFPSASVLFISVKLQDAPSSAAELLADLNSIFSELDSEVDLHKGALKIKTVCGVYMVAAGVPDESDDHTEVLACLALRMQARVSKHYWSTGKKLRIRFGIHTGPLCAGIASRLFALFSFLSLSLFTFVGAILSIFCARQKQHMCVCVCVCVCVCARARENKAPLLAVRPLAVAELSCCHPDATSFSCPLVVSLVLSFFLLSSRSQSLICVWESRSLPRYDIFGDSVNTASRMMSISDDGVCECCSVLQCVAVCCSVLQCVAVCCSVLQCVAVCCSVLQCVAVCCSVLQCVAV